MKRIIISQEEKNQILESHNSFRDVLMGHLFDKNLVNEQQSFSAPEANPAGYTEPAKVLQDAKAKCNQGSPLAKGEPTKVKEGGDAIKYKHDVDDPKVGASAGDTTFYYGDFTYQTVAPNNQIKTTGKWMCKALNVESGQCDAMKKEKQSQDFMTIEQLNKAGGTSLVNNPAMVEIITVCNEKLYRVNQKYRNQYKALTKDQKAYLDELYGIGSDDDKANVPKLDPVTNAEIPIKWVLARYANQAQINQIGFKEIVINPAPNNPFDYPVTIYLKVEGEEKVKGSELQAAKDRMRSETDSRQYCNNAIEVFYTAFVMQGTSNLSPSEFNKFKSDVEGCAKRAILLKDVNLDRKARAQLTALMGQASPNYITVDRNSAFLIRVNPPRTPRT